MTPKHTPGPWFVSTPGHASQLYVGPVVVASHRTALGRDASHPEVLDHIGDDELYANARLMAAAPDLLEALFSVMLCEFNSMSSRKEMVRIARAAIIKATGENQ